MSDLMVVGDKDSYSLDYLHVFELPRGMTKVVASKHLEDIMSDVTKDPCWSWCDALPKLKSLGFVEREFFTTTEY